MTPGQHQGLRVSVWRETCLCETAYGLLPDGGVVLEGQAVGAEGLDHLLDPGPSLNSDLLGARVDIQHLVKEAQAEHGFAAEGDAVGGQCRADTPKLTPCIGHHCCEGCFVMPPPSLLLLGQN